jgi:hypothetical protein
MRLSRWSIVLLGLLLIPGVAHAQALNNPQITVNENGTGTLQFPGGPPLLLSGVLAPDPGPSGLSSALTYNLLGPPSLVAGDVILSEGVGTALVVSDIIRFNPAGTGGNPAYPASLVFYSDLEAGADALADTGFPTARYTNIVTLIEVGPEGNNGVTYTPTANQPGFVAGFGVTYNIQSDVTTVPEPASGLLVAIGSGLMLVKRRCRRTPSA